MLTWLLAFASFFHHLSLSVPFASFFKYDSTLTAAALEKDDAMAAGLSNIFRFLKSSSQLPEFPCPQVCHKVGRIDLKHEQVGGVPWAFDLRLLLLQTDGRPG